MGKNADRSRESGQPDLQGNRDLLFHLLGGAPRVKRDNGYLCIGDIGKRFNRQVRKCEQAATHEEDEAEENKKWLIKRERYDALDHGNERRWSSLIELP